MEDYPKESLEEIFKETFGAVPEGILNFYFLEKLLEQFLKEKKSFKNV